MHVMSNNEMLERLAKAKAALDALDEACGGDAAMTFSPTAEWRQQIRAHLGTLEGQTERRAREEREDRERQARQRRAREAQAQAQAQAQAEAQAQAQRRAETGPPTKP